MIGFLSGILKSIKNGQTLIDVNGVGYQVNVGSLQAIELQDKIELYIHTHVREDAITLFGFKDEDGLSLFEKLISVNGVGPKSALAIVNSSPIETIKKAIEAANLNFFTAIPGIGKKGAQKIIIELKSKLGKEFDLKDLDGNPDLKKALIQLGFKNSEILAVIPAIDTAAPLNNQIKQALQLLKS